MTLDQQVAFEKLNQQAEAFYAALSDFQEVFEPNTVGIDDFIDTIQDVMYDIGGELADSEEE